jgi:hypothetical protein
MYTATYFKYTLKEIGSVISVIISSIFICNNNFQECKWLKINKYIFIVWDKFTSLLTDATEPKTIDK